MDATSACQRLSSFLGDVGLSRRVHQLHVGTRTSVLVYTCEWSGVSQTAQKNIPASGACAVLRRPETPDRLVLCSRFARSVLTALQMRTVSVGQGAQERLACATALLS